MHCFLEGRAVPHEPGTAQLLQAIAQLRVCKHTVDLRLLYVKVGGQGREMLGGTCFVVCLCGGRRGEEGTLRTCVHLLLHCKAIKHRV